MKIAIFHCSFIYTGGGERIVLEQIDHLRKDGHDVVCYAPLLDETNCFPDIIKKYQIKTFLPQLSRRVPFRYAITLLLTCMFAPIFFFKFRNVDVIIGENQPGAWLAFVISKITGKPYVAYLNHPNRILYPRPHEDWAAIKDFKYLSILFSFFRPLIAYLDRISITAAKERLVNGIFIGKEIEEVYGCSWVACPSGTFYLNSYAEREEVAKANNTRNKLMFAMPNDWYVPSRVAHYTEPVEEKNRLYEVNNDGFSIKGIVVDKPFILYTGRHQPWKRID